VVALVAIALAVLTVLIGAAWQSEGWPSGTDAWGFALAIVVGGGLVILALYWPVLARLRRGPRQLTRARAAVVTAVALNAPAYVALALVGQNRSLFAGGEALIIALALAVMGVAFGAGYAGIRRRATE
jgi:hypothetical protein